MQRTGDRPHGPDGVRQAMPVDTADRHRDVADAEGVHHGELPWRKRGQRRIRRLQDDRRGVQRVVGALHDAVRRWKSHHGGHALLPPSSVPPTA